MSWEEVSVSQLLVELKTNKWLDGTCECQRWPAERILITMELLASTSAASQYFERGSACPFRAVHSAALNLYYNGGFMNHRNITVDLKIFLDKYGLDAIVILANYLSEDQRTKRQIAVYSDNVELGNQICCELEESQNPFLELKPIEYGCDQLLVYHQENCLVASDQIILLIKEAINRRRPEMIPNSRTSSTEAVAGSAPLSQGSSGIMELYGSDLEPQPNSVNFMDNPQDANESVHAQVEANIDLVSPDSGLATIRSSRSSKESSVFLSDDSPVAEVAAHHHSYVSGFDTYSPIPEAVIAEEQPAIDSRNNSDDFDLFGFGRMPVSTIRSESSTHSADYSMADDFFFHSDSSEGQPPTEQKDFDAQHLVGNNMPNYSSDLLAATNGVLSLVEFNDGIKYKHENCENNSEKTSSLIDFLDDDSPSSTEMLQNSELNVPPTPMNSLVDGSPLDNGPPLFYPLDVVDKINEMSAEDPSQLKFRYATWWDGLEIDPKNSVFQTADAWSSSEHESVFQSPASPLIQENRDPSPSKPSQHKQAGLDYTRLNPWNTDLMPEPVSGTVPSSQEVGTLPSSSKQTSNQHRDYWDNLWLPEATSSGKLEQWPNSVGTGCQLDSEKFETWTTFDEDEGNRVKGTDTLSGELESEPHVSMPSLDAWTVNRSSSQTSPTLVRSNDSTDSHSSSKPCDMEISCTGEDRSMPESSNVFDCWQRNAEFSVKNQKVLPALSADSKDLLSEAMAAWDAFGESLGELTPQGPWDDPLLPYRSLDFGASSIGRDVVVSPPDTNYSTSDSYISPTFVGDGKENGEDELPEKDIFDSERSSSSLDEPNIWCNTEKSSSENQSTNSDNPDQCLSPTEGASPTVYPNSDVDSTNTTQDLPTGEVISSKCFSSDEEHSVSSSEDPAENYSNQTSDHSEIATQVTETFIGTSETKDLVKIAQIDTTTADLSSFPESTHELNVFSEELKTQEDPSKQMESESFFPTQQSRTLSMLEDFLENADYNEGSNSPNRENKSEPFRTQNELQSLDEKLQQPLTENSTTLDTHDAISSVTSSNPITPTYYDGTEENLEGDSFNKHFSNANVELQESLPCDPEISVPSEVGSIHPSDFYTDKQLVWGTAFQELPDSYPDKTNCSDRSELWNRETWSPNDTFASESKDIHHLSTDLQVSTDSLVERFTNKTDIGEKNKDENSQTVDENSETCGQCVPVEDNISTQGMNRWISEESDEQNLAPQSFSCGVLEDLDMWNSVTESSASSPELSNSFEAPAVVEMEKWDNISEEDQSKVHTSIEVLSDSARADDNVLEENVDSKYCGPAASSNTEECLAHYQRGPSDSELWSDLVSVKAESTTTAVQIVEPLAETVTENVLQGGTQEESNSEEDEVSGGSSNDLTSSSESSPDKSGDLENIPPWDIKQDNIEDNTSYTNSFDFWSHSKNSELKIGAEGDQVNHCVGDVLSKDDPVCSGHKVPTNFDIWNTRIEADTDSTLTSPETNEVSEHSEALEEDDGSATPPDKVDPLGLQSVSLGEQSSDTTPGTDEDGLYAAGAPETHQKASPQNSSFASEISDMLSPVSDRARESKVGDSGDDSNLKMIQEAQVNHAHGLAVEHEQQTEIVGSASKDTGQPATDYSAIQSFNEGTLNNEIDLCCPASLHRKQSITLTVCNQEKEEPEGASSGYWTEYEKQPNEQQSAYGPPLSPTTSVQSQSNPHWMSQTLDQANESTSQLNEMDATSLIRRDDEETRTNQRLCTFSDHNTATDSDSMQTRTPEFAESLDHEPLHPAFVPDILHDNLQECSQFFSIEPDLWNDTEHCFAVTAERDNPDVIHFCDTVLQASDSPDVCRDYDSDHLSSLNITGKVSRGGVVEDSLAAAETINEAVYDSKEQAQSPTLISHEDSTEIVHGELSHHSAASYDSHNPFVFDTFNEESLWKSFSDNTPDVVEPGIKTTVCAVIEGEVPPTVNVTETCHLEAVPVICPGSMSPYTYSPESPSQRTTFFAAERFTENVIEDSLCDSVSSSDSECQGEPIQNPETASVDEETQQTTQYESTCPPCSNTHNSDTNIKSDALVSNQETGGKLEEGKCLQGETFSVHHSEDYESWEETKYENRGDSEHSWAAEPPQTAKCENKPDGEEGWVAEPSQLLKYEKRPDCEDGWAVESLPSAKYKNRPDGEGLWATQHLQSAMYENRQDNENSWAAELSESVKYENKPDSEDPWTTTEPLQSEKYENMPDDEGNWAAEHPQSEKYENKPGGEDGWAAEPSQSAKYENSQVGEDRWAAEPSQSVKYKNSPYDEDSWGAEPSKSAKYENRPHDEDCLPAEPLQSAKYENIPDDEDHWAVDPTQSMKYESRLDHEANRAAEPFQSERYENMPDGEDHSAAEHLQLEKYENELDCEDPWATEPLQSAKYTNKSDGENCWTVEHSQSAQYENRLDEPTQSAKYENIPGDENRLADDPSKSVTYENILDGEACRAAESSQSERYENMPDGEDRWAAEPFQLAKYEKRLDCDGPWAAEHLQSAIYKNRPFGGDCWAAEPSQSVRYEIRPDNEDGLAAEPAKSVKYKNRPDSEDPMAAEPSQSEKYKNMSDDEDDWAAEHPQSEKYENKPDNEDCLAAESSQSEKYKNRPDGEYGLTAEPPQSVKMDNRPGSEDHWAAEPWQSAKYEKRPVSEDLWTAEPSQSVKYKKWSDNEDSCGAEPSKSAQYENKPLSEDLWAVEPLQSMKYKNWPDDEDCWGAEPSKSAKYENRPRGEDGLTAEPLQSAKYENMPDSEDLWVVDHIQSVKYESRLDRENSWAAEPSQSETYENMPDGEDISAAEPLQLAKYENGLNCEDPWATEALQLAKYKNKPDGENLWAVEHSQSVKYENRLDDEDRWATEPSQSAKYENIPNDENHWSADPSQSEKYKNMPDEEDDWVAEDPQSERYENKPDSEDGLAAEPPQSVKQENRPGSEDQWAAERLQSAKYENRLVGEDLWTAEPSQSETYENMPDGEDSSPSEPLQLAKYENGLGCEDPVATEAVQSEKYKNKSDGENRWAVEHSQSVKYENKLDDEDCWAIEPSQSAKYENIPDDANHWAAEHSQSEKYENMPDEEDDWAAGHPQSEKYEKKPESEDGLAAESLQSVKQENRPGREDHYAAEPLQPAKYENRPDGEDGLTAEPLHSAKHENRPDGEDDLTAEPPQSVKQENRPGSEDHWAAEALQSEMSENMPVGEHPWAVEPSQSVKYIHWHDDEDSWGSEPSKSATYENMPRGEDSLPAEPSLSAKYENSPHSEDCLPAEPLKSAKYENKPDGEDRWAVEQSQSVKHENRLDDEDCWAAETSPSAKCENIPDDENNWAAKPSQSEKYENIPDDEDDWAAEHPQSEKYENIPDDEDYWAAEQPQSEKYENIPDDDDDWAAEQPQSEKYENKPDSEDGLAAESSQSEKYKNRPDGEDGLTAEPPQSVKMDNRPGSEDHWAAEPLQSAKYENRPVSEDLWTAEPSQSVKYKNWSDNEDSCGAEPSKSAQYENKPLSEDRLPAEPSLSAKYENSPQSEDCLPAEPLKSAKYENKPDGEDRWAVDHIQLVNYESRLDREDSWAAEPSQSETNENMPDGEDSSPSEPLQLAKYENGLDCEDPMATEALQLAKYKNKPDGENRWAVEHSQSVKHENRLDDEDRWAAETSPSAKCENIPDDEHHWAAEPSQSEKYENIPDVDDDWAAEQPQSEKYENKPDSDDGLADESSQSAKYKNRPDGEDGLTAEPPQSVKMDNRPVSEDVWTAEPSQSVKYKNWSDNEDSCGAEPSKSAQYENKPLSEDRLPAEPSLSAKNENSPHSEDCLPAEPLQSVKYENMPNGEDRWAVDHIQSVKYESRLDRDNCWAAEPSQSETNENMPDGEDSSPSEPLQLAKYENGLNCEDPVATEPLQSEKYKNKSDGENRWTVEHSQSVKYENRLDCWETEPLQSAKYENIPDDENHWTVDPSQSVKHENRLDGETRWAAEPLQSAKYENGPDGEERWAVEPSQSVKYEKSLDGENCWTAELCQSMRYENEADGEDPRAVEPLQSAENENRPDGEDCWAVEPLHSAEYAKKPNSENHWTAEPSQSVKYENRQDGESCLEAEASQSAKYEKIPDGEDCWTVDPSQSVTYENNLAGESRWAADPSQLPKYENRLDGEDYWATESSQSVKNENRLGSDDDSAAEHSHSAKYETRSHSEDRLPAEPSQSAKYEIKPEGEDYSAVDPTQSVNYDNTPDGEVGLAAEPSQSLVKTTSSSAPRAANTLAEHATYTEQQLSDLVSKVEPEISPTYFIQNNTVATPPSADLNSPYDPFTESTSEDLPPKFFTLDSEHDTVPTEKWKMFDEETKIKITDSPADGSKGFFYVTSETFPDADGMDKMGTETDTPKSRLLSAEDANDWIVIDDTEANLCSDGSLETTTPESPFQEDNVPCKETHQGLSAECSGTAAMINACQVASALGPLGHPFQPEENHPSASPEGLGGEEHHSPGSVEQDHSWTLVANQNESPKTSPDESDSGTLTVGSGSEYSAEEARAVIGESCLHGAEAGDELFTSLAEYCGPGDNIVMSILSKKVGGAGTTTAETVHESERETEMQCQPNPQDGTKTAQDVEASTCSFVNIESEKGQAQR